MEQTRIAELLDVEANAAAESPAPPAAEVAALAEAIEEVRQAHGDDQAEAILASIPGHERTLHVDRARVLAAVRTIAERKPGSFTTSAVAYFASVMRDVVHWPRARVEAKIDRTRARPVVELSDDAQRLKSIREAYGGNEKHGHDHMIWNQGWSEARYDQAAAELAKHEAAELGAVAELPNVEANAAAESPAEAAAMAPGERPSGEVLAEVLGPWADECDPPELASLLILKLNGRGVNLRPLDDGTIKAELVNPSVDRMTELEKVVLRWLKPHLVAELRGSSP